MLLDKTIRRTKLFVTFEKFRHFISDISLSDKVCKLFKVLLLSTESYLQIHINNVLSLLDVLAGRRERDEYSGTVLVNGSQQRNDFRLLSGFVVQVSFEMYNG